MHLFFAHYIAQLGWLIYPLIAVLVFFEGEAVIYSIMFLAFQGSLNLYLSLAIICASVLATDLSSYAIGFYGPARLPKLANFYEKLIKPLDSQLIKMSFGIFLISKFTYGLHRSVIIRVGMLRLPLKKFLQIDAITTAIWIAIISGFAYGTWKSVRHLHRSFKYAEIGLAVGVVILVVGGHLFSYYSKKQILSDKK